MEQELEQYARGLALAEGTVHCGTSSLRYHMGKEAEAALREVSALGSVNGLRWHKDGSCWLVLRGKAWWKNSVEGLDRKHAFRGYIDGDGCWYRHLHRRNYGKRIYEYLETDIYVSDRELFLCGWVEECLGGFKFLKRVKPPQELRWTHSLIHYKVVGGESVRLAKHLYSGANVYINGRNPLQEVSNAQLS